METKFLGKFLRFEYSRAVYLAVLLAFALIGFCYSLWQSSVLTPEKISKEARSLNDEGKYDESIALLLYYVEEFPENEEIVSLIQSTLPLYVKLQVTSGYEKISKNPKDVQGYLSAASGFALMKEFFRAMEMLTAGIVANPDSAELWMNVGIIELKKERDAEAYSAFRRVTEIDDKNSQAFNQLAFLQSRSKDERLIDLSKAKADAKKAISIDPKNADYWETLSEVYFRQGEREDAKKAIQFAIDLSPHQQYYKIQKRRFETAVMPDMSMMPTHIAK